MGLGEEGRSCEGESPVTESPLRKRTLNVSHRTYATVSVFLQPTVRTAFGNFALKRSSGCSDLEWYIRFGTVTSKQNGRGHLATNIIHVDKKNRVESPIT